VSRMIWIYRFQSTLLQEERREDQKRMITIYNFNPRSYKRSDFIF